MIGSNTLNLNEATMIQIVQHYFDTVLFADSHAPTVKGVEYEQGNYQSKTFKITTNTEAQS